MNPAAKPSCQTASVTVLLTACKLFLTLEAFLWNSGFASATMSEFIGEQLHAGERWEVSGPYGGQGGIYFTDWWNSLDNTKYLPTHPPDQINIRHGGRIDNIQIFYAGYNGYPHGGDGGLLTRLRLYEGDRIIRVTGRSGLGPGAGVDQITFHTSRGRELGPFGGSGGMPFDTGLRDPSCYLAFISGRSDLRLDQINFHWRCKREEVFSTESQFHIQRKG